MIDRLGDPALTEEATEALAGFGDRVVGTLRDYLTDLDTPVAVRRQIPDVLLRIGTQQAHSVLAESMLDADTQVRYSVIIGLNKLGELHPTWSLDRRLVETVLGAEIMGHLRSYQILGTLGREMSDSDASDRGDPRSDGAGAGADLQAVEAAFPAAGSAQRVCRRAVAQPGRPRQRARVPREHPQPPAALAPAAAARQRGTGDDRTELANRVLGTQVASGAEAVQSLLSSEDPWLRSCAAYAIGALEPRRVRRTAGTPVDATPIRCSERPLDRPRRGSPTTDAHDGCVSQGGREAGLRRRIGPRRFVSRLPTLRRLPKSARELM